MTMSSIPFLLACVATLVATGNAFLCPSSKISITKLAASTSSPAEASWQNDVDEFLNVDTSCATRRSNVLSLLQKSREIVGDVASAVRSRDIKKIAPPELKYGKAVQGIQAVRRQVLKDIIPGSLTKGIPRLIEEGPKIAQKAGSVIRTLPEKGRDAIGSLRDMSQDPSMLQYNLDTLRKEMRNVVQSTPVGLDTPTFEVMKKTESYEVRSYGGYSVCSTAFTGGDGSEMADPLAAGNSFTELAGYIFGEDMAMTTPGKLTTHPCHITQHLCSCFCFYKQQNPIILRQYEPRSCVTTPPCVLPQICYTNIQLPTHLTTTINDFSTSDLWCWCHGICVTQRHQFCQRPSTQIRFHHAQRCTSRGASCPRISR